MKVSYNAPVILSFTLLCVIVRFLGDDFTQTLFTVPPRLDWGNPVEYFRLFSHIVGHGSWQHLIGNFTLILVIGPLVEEKYGSKPLLIMMLVTALITGILNVTFLSTGLLGASGIVFMLILLASMTNIKAGTIPMTFILVAILYLGGEVLNAFGDNNVSQFAHIIGGVFGGIFGFALAKKETKNVI